MMFLVMRAVLLVGLTLFLEFGDARVFVCSLFVSFLQILLQFVDVHSV